MISLGEKFQVLRARFVEGRGIKRIARETGLLGNAVKRYAREFAEQKAEILAGGDKSEILLAMTDKPRYHTESRERTVVTDEVVEVIRACLAENDRKKTLGQSKLAASQLASLIALLRKPQRCAVAPFRKNACVFSGNCPPLGASVSNAVRILRQTKKEAFIKQRYDFGEVCEFDWGKANLTV
jgi:hypothetical protein